MIAIDLFCGKGGWTNGLLEAGFTVYGFDNKPQPDYKGIFVLADILELTANDLRAYSPDFATCSSPCEQFSVHCMKHFHPNPKHPEMGIRLFEHSRTLLEELEIPYVMENVRCAEKFVGKAVNHCGPFYLWGNAIPAVMPKELYAIQKGMNTGAKMHRDGCTRAEITAWAKNFRGTSHVQRSAFTSNASMIPHSIARAVSQGALQLLTQEGK